MKCKYLVSFALLFCALLISFSSIADSYGHGLGSEILPPELLGSKMVTLEISSHPIPDADTREIYFSLYETDTGITVKDVTYSITAEKENKLLFDETFQSDDGIVVLKLIPAESQQISVEEQSVDFFSSAFNHNKIVDVKGNALYGYVILKDTGENRSQDNLRKEINQIITEHIGPIAKLDKIQFTEGLPKTRSGKIMRRILRKIACNEISNLGDTSTLLNPEVVEAIIANTV